MPKVIEIDKADIVDFYNTMMKAQSKLGGNSLCGGGNMGMIISAYIYAKYGVTVTKETAMKGISARLG